MRHLTTLGNMASYRNPPILEAVLEVQFEDALLSGRDMERFAKKIESRYPHHEVMRDYTLAVNVNPSGLATGARPDLVQEWHKCMSSDGVSVCNVRPKSIVTARLAPYTRWEDLFSRFESDFATLRKVCGYKRVSRCGVRFVNRIDVPSASSAPVDPRRYLNIYPSVPSLDYDNMTTFVARAQHVDRVSGASVILAAAQLDPVLINCTSILLDIDVFFDKEIPLKIEDVMVRIDQLRTIKNEYFERLVTDDARALFNA